MATSETISTKRAFTRPSASLTFVRDMLSSIVQEVVHTLSVWFRATGVGGVGCNGSFWHQSNGVPQLHRCLMPGPDRVYRAIAGEPIAIL